MNQEDSAKVGGWLDHASKMARTVAEHNAEETVAALTAERDNALAALRRRSSQRDQLDERCEELVDERDRATARAERAEATLQRVRARLEGLAEAIGWQREKYGDGTDRRAMGRLIGMQDAYSEVAAALRSTDPVEAAPKQHVPERGRLTIEVPDNRGGGTITRGALLCAACGVEWPCPAAPVPEERSDEKPQCPTCGPTTLERHPRLSVMRCSNCKEHLRSGSALPVDGETT